MFAHVARLKTIRLVIAINVNRNWHMLHLDVKFAFPNGPLQEQVYVLQYFGFLIENNEGMLYKSLAYGNWFIF